MSVATDLLVADAVLDYGDQALLLEFGSTADVLAWTAALREAALPGVLDIVPAFHTVLVRLDGPRYQAVTRQRLRKLRVTPVETVPPGRVDVVIDVVYDGADLAAVADHTGLTTAQVIDAHTTAFWRVAFSGFAPGLTHLVGGDPRLAMQQRPEMRASVPAGSVVLVHEFSGIHPRRSPSGGQLIGRTDAVLWDLDRPGPALLTPGYVGAVQSRPARRRCRPGNGPAEEQGDQTQPCDDAGPETGPLRSRAIKPSGRPARS